MKTILKFIGFAFLAITLASTSNNKKVVIIDPSFGGKYVGDTYEEFTEKDITLSIANKIVELNTNPDIEIILTRIEDESMSIKKRVKFINGLNPDLAISLHIGSYKDDTASGTKIFVCPKSEKKEESKELALKLKEAFSFRKTKYLKSNFQLIKSVKSPIAQVKLGFLTNEDDRILLTEEEGQEKIAKAILEAIK